MVVEVNLIKTLIYYYFCLPQGKGCFPKSSLMIIILLKVFLIHLLAL